MASNKKQIDDSDIIAAMLSSRTRQEAADKLHISARQLFERLKSYDLQASLSAHRADALRTRLQALEDAQQAAISVILDIMKSEDSTPTERLKAAALILDSGRAARAELAAADADAVGKQRGAERMDKEMDTQHKRLNGEFVLDTPFSISV